MNGVQATLRSLRATRYSGLYFTGAIILAIWTVLRLVLLARCWPDVDAGSLDLCKALLSGLVFDLALIPVVLVPPIIWVAFAPNSWFQSRTSRGILLAEFFLIVFGVLFGVLSEWFFWDEFEHRFNFIAVDYLVYTHEVLTNIGESYPVAPLLAIVGALAGALTWFARGTITAPTLRPATSTLDRAGHAPVWFAYAALVALWIGPAIWDFSKNSFVNEVAKNGPYSLLSAFRDSTLAYDRFYAVRDPQAVFRQMRDELAADNAQFTSDDPQNLARLVTYSAPERRANVMIILVESLSGEFLGALGDQRGLTPELDALAKDSLLFTNFYATGTRTVRGMEAIALSIPPTPGCAVIKRPTPTRFPAIFDMFQERGYDTAFFMGGNAYFDNHRGFFEKQGCRVLDNSSFLPGEVHFSNAWGVCDEDLFTMTLREADEQHARGKPFCFLTLTCSNHRPYTYPQKIDIPSGSGRDGAVKYTDYAIGQAIRQARTKPWFDDTIFVIVADHCASSAGKTPVPAHRYHIPLVIYSPKFVPPGKHTGLCSQIDVGPTLLGLLNFSHRSEFFGCDVLRKSPDRAFIGTYQRLGMLQQQHLTVLDVKRRASAFKIEANHEQPLEQLDDRRLSRAISYYQSASELLRRADERHRLAAESGAQGTVVAVKR